MKSSERESMLARLMARDLDRIESAALMKQIEDDDAFKAQYDKAYDEHVDRHGFFSFLPADPDLVDCFSIDTLERFVRGRLSAKEEAVIRAHLPCAICGPQIEHLEEMIRTSWRPFDRIQPWVDSVRKTFQGRLSPLVPIVATLAVVGAFLFSMDGTSPTLAYKIVSEQPMRATARLGDTLDAEASTDWARHAVLRVYQEGVGLRGECPGMKECTVEGDRIQLKFPLDEAGLYFLVLITNNEEIPKSRGSLLTDLNAMGSAYIQVRDIEVK